MAKQRSNFGKYWDFYILGIFVVLVIVFSILSRVTNFNESGSVFFFAVVVFFLFILGNLGLFIKMIIDKNKRVLRIIVIISIGVLSLLLFALSGLLSVFSRGGGFGF